MTAGVGQVSHRSLARPHGGLAPGQGPLEHFKIKKMSLENDVLTVLRQTHV